MKQKIIIAGLILISLTSIGFADELESLTILEPKEVIENEEIKNSTEIKIEKLAKQNPPLLNIEKDVIVYKIEDEKIIKNNFLIEKIIKARNEKERIDVFKKNIDLTIKNKDVSSKDTLKKEENDINKISEDIEIKKDNNKNNTKQGLDSETKEKKTILPNLPDEILVNKEKLEKIILERSNEIFTNFDIILYKLKTIVLIIDFRISSVENNDNKNNGEQIKILRNNLINISEKIKILEKRKAEVWILMHQIIQISDQEKAVINLGEVEILLQELKVEMKNISSNIKEIILSEVFQKINK